MNTNQPMSRRDALRQGASLLAGAAIFVVSMPRAKAGKAAKSDYYYQDIPRDGKSCSSCRMFSAQADGKGVCAVVEGLVVPTGWCMAYSPRAE